MCEYNALGDLQRVLHPLELHVQEFVSCPTRVLASQRWPPQGQPEVAAAEPSLQPQRCFLKILMKYQTQTSAIALIFMRVIIMACQRLFVFNKEMNVT